MAVFRSGPCGMGELAAARTRDVIDTAPAYTQADADRLNARFAGVDAGTMLAELFAEGSLGRVAVVSSFGTESAVLLHLVATADRSVPVMFVDTLKMFPETLAYRDTLTGLFGLTNSSVVAPDLAVLAAKGLELHAEIDALTDAMKTIESQLAEERTARREESSK